MADGKPSSPRSAQLSRSWRSRLWGSEALGASLLAGSWSKTKSGGVCIALGAPSLNSGFDHSRGKEGGEAASMSRGPWGGHALPVTCPSLEVGRLFPAPPREESGLGGGPSYTGPRGPVATCSVPRPVLGCGSLEGPEMPIPRTLGSASLRASVASSVNEECVGTPARYSCQENEESGV